jgi:hypothetical protein
MFESCRAHQAIGSLARLFTPLLQICSRRTRSIADNTRGAQFLRAVRITSGPTGLLDQSVRNAMMAALGAAAQGKRRNRTIETLDDCHFGPRRRRQLLRRIQLHTD